MTKIVGIIKAFILFIALLGVGAIMMLIAIFRWKDPRLNNWFTLSFSAVVKRVIGLKIVYLNPERIKSRRPAVFIGNHQSGLDLGIIGTICPPFSVIVAKKEIQYIPLFGWFFKAAGNLMIDRARADTAKAMMNQVTRELSEKNLNLVIFPEGTRNKHRTDADTEKLLPFKKGAFHIASRTGFPIVPVVCSSLKGKAVWETFDLSGGTVVISVLPPFETTGLSAEEQEGLKDRVHAAMTTELIRVNQLATQYEQNDRQPKSKKSCC